MGIYNEQRIIECLKKTRFITDKKKYYFAKLPFTDYSKLLESIKKISGPFFEIIYDKNEITIVAEENIWNTINTYLHPLKVDFPLGIITCDVAEENPTGYLLKVMEILSPNNIGVYVQGAYTTDSILVSYADLDKAISLLTKTFTKVS